MGSSNYGTSEYQRFSTGCSTRWAEDIRTFIQAEHEQQRYWPALLVQINITFKQGNTAEDIRPWAKALGYEGNPFGWDEGRRLRLKCQLDAYYVHLYGLNRDELCYILDPATVKGDDFPSVTFPGLKRKELEKYGEYRTQRLVLEEYDRLMKEQSNV